MKTSPISTAIFVAFCCSVFCFAGGVFAETDSNNLDSSSSDGLATVYQLVGSASLIVKGSPLEKNLKVGNIIQAGDSIYTRKGASISISFDQKRLNAVRIPADSRVTFTSIEPTEMKIEEGSVFNVVDGLAEGSIWKVVTPSMVAAVRGTVFMASYVNGQFYAATLNVPNDGKASAITVLNPKHGGSATIAEGKEIRLDKQDIPSEENVQDLEFKHVAGLNGFFKEVSLSRQDQDRTRSAPELVAEFKEITCDPSGKNCSNTTCTRTASGDVCTYS